MSQGELYANVDCLRKLMHKRERRLVVRYNFVGSEAQNAVQITKIVCV